jgi:hypothetical protein
MIYIYLHIFYSSSPKEGNTISLLNTEKFLPDYTASLEYSSLHKHHDENLRSHKKNPVCVWVKIFPSFTQYYTAKEQVEDNVFDVTKTSSYGL